MISKASLLLRTKPAHDTLSSYIDNYVLFSHHEGKLLHKNMLPCPGVCLLFNFSDILINGDACPAVTIIGLHDTVYKIEGSTDSIETLIVQFSPWGFRPLTPLQAYKYYTECRRSIWQ